MGTYINFIQTDTSKIEETEAILSGFVFEDGIALGLWSQEDINIENEKLKKTGNGCPDFLQLGEGQFKLSSTSEEDIDVFVSAMEKATKYCGLTFSKIPSNLDDYISDYNISRFYDFSLYTELKEKEEQEYSNYRTAQKKALEKKREELNGGVLKVKSWGIKDFWLIFGNVETPTFLQYDFEANGETYKELYKDEEGLAYMLIPLMTFDTNGVEKILKSLEYAWNNLGLRTEPVSILASVYKIYPKVIKFGRMKLFEYIPKGYISVENIITKDEKSNKWISKRNYSHEVSINQFEYVKFSNMSGKVFFIKNEEIGDFILENS